VPEHELQGAKTPATPAPCHRERMPEHVRSYGLGDPGPRCDGPYNSLHGPNRQHAGERFYVRELPREELVDARRKRYRPPAPSFAAEHERAILEIDVSPLELHELGNP